MKKTILLEKGKAGVLTQIMREALAFQNKIITKSVIVFDSKKEAQEVIKGHVCGHDLVAYTLTNDQEKLIKLLQNSGDRCYILLSSFLKMKN